LSEEERRERSEQRRLREAKDTGRTSRAPYSGGTGATSAPSAALPAYPHFDFSKPYEPPAKDASLEVAAVAAKAPLPHRPQVRSIGTLLGRKKLDKV